MDHLRTKQHNHRKRSVQKGESTTRTKVSSGEETSSPLPSQAAQKSKASRANKAKKPASKPAIQPGRLIRGSQPSRLLNLALSQATVNLNNLYELLPSLSVNSAAPLKYTPAKVRTVYVLESPIYNDRDFRLVDVALEVTTHRSGLTTEAWRIRVRDHKDLDETRILQPFQIAATTLRWTEKAHGRKSDNRPCFRSPRLKSTFDQRAVTCTLTCLNAVSNQHKQTQETQEYNIDIVLMIRPSLIAFGEFVFLNERSHCTA
jgi:hypothetical protein